MSTVDAFAESDKKHHILVVDDDERLRDLLSRFLRENGFLVTTAADAQDARGKIAYFLFDLIVMDVMMPEESGLQLTSALKEMGIVTPVLLLTALEDVDSRIEGFESGADDYLPKPFEPRELVLRMNAILRRATVKNPSPSPTSAIRFGRWSLDMERGALVSADERQSLTQAESVLLKALISRKGEAVSREDLAKLCGLDAAERTIDVQVTRLRKKLEEDPKTPQYIQTLRGKGYVLWVDE